MTEHAYPDPVTRRFITLFVMAASVMSALDTTIANVALPHMQGSVSASQDEITWVLTSYIVASAIFTPLGGWLANRFGRKRMMLIAVVAFTVTSALCGLATHLGELIAFRFMQGMFGASLAPMSQAILLDINPPEKHGPAMAIWGMGVVLAPIIGPVLGGYLTDNMSWRWVFYLNLPIGIITFFGISAFVAETKLDIKAKLDLIGFAMLAIAIASLQMMLDRGQQQDWFSSTEICIEAALALFFFYAFFVHILTVPNPFVQLAMFKDRNFLFGAIYGFLFGVLLFSVLALLPTMLQQLMGYPVMVTGLVVAPRGVGTLFTMILVGPLVRRVDARILILIGFALVALSLWMMAGFSLNMDSRLVVLSGLVSGLGNGFVFVPLSTISFATLDARFRNEATAMFTLIRNIGSAVGISILQTMTYRNATAVHSRLVEGIRPDNPILALRFPGFDFSATSAVASLNAEITRQANMVGYVDGYWALCVAILCVAPIVLMLRSPRRRAGEEPPLPIHLD